MPNFDWSDLDRAIETYAEKRAVVTRPPNTFTLDEFMAEHKITNRANAHQRLRDLKRKGIVKKVAEARVITRGEDGKLHSRPQAFYTVVSKNNQSLE